MKRLFGLEKDFFDELDIKERNVYRLMFVVFLLILAFASISGGYLVYLISTSIYLSLVGAVFFGFIIFSVLRFSLISIERNMKFPDEKFKFFSSTFLFRLVLLAFFGMVVGVPIATLLQQEEVRPLLQAKRQEMIVEYNQYLEESKALNLRNRQIMLEEYEQKASKILMDIQSIEKADKEVNLDKSNYSSNNFELLALRSELKSIYEKQGLLKNEISVQDSLIQINMEQKMLRFKENINKSELPIFQMSLTINTSKGKAVVAFSATLFVILLVLILWLNHAREFLYAKRAVYYHRDFTQSTYHQTELKIAQWVKSRYGVDYKSSSAFLDAPFNKVANNNHIRKESEMKLKDYLNQLR